MAFPDKPVAHLLGSNGPVHTVAYSASPGTYILTGSADRTVRLYNPAPAAPARPASGFITKPADDAPDSPSIPEGRLIKEYSAHGYEVLSIDVAADNARFVSAGGDRAVFLWDVATAQTLRRFGGAAGGGHTSRVNSVCFAGEGDGLVVSGGFDTAVRVWDARSGSMKPIMVLGDARDGISAVAVPRGGAEILAGSVDGRLRSYDLRMSRLVTDVLGPSVTSLSLTRDGKTALVGSLDSSIRLMDRDNGACLKTYAAEGWRNEELRVQSVLGGKEKYVVAGDELTAAPDGTGSSSTSGRIWAWDLLTGKLAAKIEVPWGPGGNDARKKVFSKDGKEKARRNVISCVAWREQGWGDQFCVGGTSGVVTVFASS